MAGTYDGIIGKAKIYVNDELKNMSVNEYGGFLSLDWNMRVGIGDHKNYRPVLGFVDEFRIYNYPVTKNEITEMFNKCSFNSKQSDHSSACFLAYCMQFNINNLMICDRTKIFMIRSILFCTILVASVFFNITSSILPYP